MRPFESYKLDLQTSSPLIMGIVNVTPDSFYDGGKTASYEAAIAQAEKMLEQGADIIDIGGESTRPGKRQKVEENEEIDRVAAVVEYVSHRLGAFVSVDTSHPKVMEVAVNNGASMINDVRALQRPGALEMAVKCHVPVVLMHSLINDPVDNQLPVYDDIVFSIQKYLQERVTTCCAAGMSRSHIILDPGFGGGLFGKNTQDNLRIIMQFTKLKTLGFPLLVGVSRKSFIGDILQKGVHDRLLGSLLFEFLLLFLGAKIVRVHDIVETKEVIKLIHALTAVTNLT